MKSATNTVRLFKSGQNNGIVIKWNLLMVRIDCQLYFCFPNCGFSGSDKSQSRIMISERRETNEVSPQCFQAPVQGEGT